jgi:nucleotide-binding universal stress UspA family protein
VFKRILVPLDLSDKHGPALDRAAELAGSSGEVVLLHVIESIAGLGVEEEQSFYSRLERMARDHLQRFAHLLSQRQVRCQGEIRIGHRATEIIRFAQASASDLIILTVPRFDPTNPATSGSLGWRISLLAPCPVLLVK